MTERLDPETLVKRLRYQGRQYAAGQTARGGSSGLHYLEQAADLINALQIELSHCRDDYRYLRTIIENKDSLHLWLDTRVRKVGALLPADAPSLNLDDACSGGPIGSIPSMQTGQYAAAMRDAITGGTGILQGGKRVDPQAMRQASQAPNPQQLEDDDPWLSGDDMLGASS